MRTAKYVAGVRQKLPEATEELLFAEVDLRDIERDPALLVRACVCVRVCVCLVDSSMQKHVLHRFVNLVYLNCGSQQAPSDEVSSLVSSFSIPVKGHEKVPNYKNSLMHISYAEPKHYQRF
jgi:hypothetical protein